VFSAAARGGGEEPTTGNVSLTSVLVTVPRGSTVMVASGKAAISWQMVRPSPVPEVLVVKNASKLRSSRVEY
jgi:hypothetical protein